MKKGFQIIALLVAVLALAWWTFAGANRGWTRTSVPVTIVDEVTGIEAIEYQDRFVPGVELLGGALLSAFLLAGISFLFPKTTNRNK